MVLDGYGISDKTEGNAIALANTPVMDKLKAEYPYVKGAASGLAVGLPDGQMGNSEVGHMNIGAGRIIYQELTRITKSIQDGEFFDNAEMLEAIENCKKNNSDLHVWGLLSSGGVHSHNTHLYAILELCKKQNFENVYVHPFFDGRDTAPASGKGFLEELIAEMKKIGVGKVASLSGRYYAMDRDNRWERVKEAYDLIVNGIGTPTQHVEVSIQQSYDEGITDEFIKPIVHVGSDHRPVGVIEPGDMVIFFNYRNDRAKELTIALTQRDIPEQQMKKMPLYYCCMTPYDATFEGLHILFNKENVENTLGEVISKAGLKQLRIAETEKYAHVTFFFNGGREAQFEGESRILVPSPKVATYDLQPEMSAPEVAEKLVEQLNAKSADFVCLNFANGDMVGHTGVYAAIQKAVATVDRCVEKVVTAAQANGYDVLIIADHGNADNAVNPDGTPNTAHSLNPVPCIWVTDEKGKALNNGVLADVAPTILQIMGIAQPAEMTGKSLIK